MSDIDPNKLKVTELREELKNRGLDTKGTKAVLVKRLKKALNAEAGGAAVDESLTEETSLDDSSQDGGGALDESSQDITDTSATEAPPAAEPEPEPEPVVEPEPEEVAEPEPVKKKSPVKVSQSVKEEPAKEESAKLEPAKEEPAKEEPVKVEPAKEEPEPMEQTSTEEVNEEEEKKLLGETEEEVPVEELTTVDEATYEDDDAKDEDKKSSENKRKRSHSHDKHRSRSRSPRERRRSRSPRDRKPRSPKKIVMDDETWESSTQTLLDKYNSDLNLKIDETGLKAEPLTHDGFAMMWAGARAMFGVNKGKVAFEVKLLENMHLDHVGQEETNPHVARVGWSMDSTSMLLGEEPLSYGYGGTGKASVDCKFEDYGEKYTAGDVITGYIDFEDAESVFFSYSKNGEELGVCFSIEKSTLGDNALFPHVLTKNTSFEINFGAQEEPWFPLKEEFVFIEQVEDKIRGTLPPAKKEDCQIIMMVGLPGSGKTTWCEKHRLENMDKKFNLLGTNNIIDKMKVMGLPRKRNYAGRWDVLIDLSNKCLNKMLESGASKKRNYILDQVMQMAFGDRCAKKVP